MKFVITVLAACLPLLAQEFSTGQAARIVIGQPTFTAESPKSSASVLGGVGGLAIHNGTLLVTDANRIGALGDSPANGTPDINHRVLIFRDIAGQLPGPTDPFPQDSSRCPACRGVANVVLGQTAFDKFAQGRGRSGLRLPTAVATDGTRVAVADTDNNRVLIWNSFPTSNGQPADVVLGQTDFDRAVAAISQTAMRGPQGVWIQDGRLFVCDTQNNRILVWNRVPTTNNAPADYVLGQRDFTTGFTVETRDPAPTADNLLTPVSVTSDGVRLYVSDLGHNRVLIWNRIPTSTATPADIVLGQKDFTSAVDNDSPNLCPSNGTDSDNNPTYPERCAKTLSFPRFALSDGTRLFVADTGNDRVLVWNRIPNASQTAPDAILGQQDEVSNFVSGFLTARTAAVDALRSPMALATDGQNLYVTDAFNRRVVVYSRGTSNLPLNGTTNAASQIIRSIGWVTLGGEIRRDDSFKIRVNDARDYEYKFVEGETFTSVVNKFVELINKDAGDPDVIASPSISTRTLLLVARRPGEDGDSNAVQITTTGPNATTAAAVTFQLQPFFGGRDAASLGPGTIISITGEGLASGTGSADTASANPLPTELADTQVFVDGLAAPLYYVSPNQINAQLPYEISDTTSASMLIRTRRDGQWVTTRAVPLNIITENPGLFAEPGTEEPRRGYAFHVTDRAHASISVDGGLTFAAGVRATISLGEGDSKRDFSYTTVADDTLNKIRDGLIKAINETEGSPVEAFAGSTFSRIILRSRTVGPEGNGLKVATEVSFGTVTNASLTLTVYGDGTLCCANTPGAPVTAENPLVPGEQFILLATGLGLVTNEDARKAQITGKPYEGPTPTEPIQFVNAQAGGVTMQVLSVSLKRGSVGIYEVLVQNPVGLPTNERTVMWIGQGFAVSNQVALPVKGVEEEDEEN